jgi:hypothetical protein
MTIVEIGANRSHKPMKVTESMRVGMKAGHGLRTSKSKFA